MVITIGPINAIHPVMVIMFAKKQPRIEKTMMAAKGPLSAIGVKTSAIIPPTLLVVMTLPRAVPPAIRRNTPHLIRGIDHPHSKTGLSLSPGRMKHNRAASRKI